MEILSRSRIFGVAAACVVAAVAAFADEEKEKKPIPGELQGFYVRVKSGITGEKQLYYNKDGTLRTSLGDNLLGGEFELDDSLLGDGGGLELNLSPDVSPEKKSVPASDSADAPVVPVAGKTSSAVPTEVPAVPSRPRRASAVTPTEEVGVVDEDATLKKFSRERNDFGVNPERFKKVIDPKLNDRGDETFSLREWQGSSAFGIRRYVGLNDENYAMRTAELEAGAREMGLFETRSGLAGEKMFVRTNDGLLEVRLNSRYSSMQHTRASERTTAVRESSGFSMQDINRYQFRRNRSSDPGLPVVSPGGNGAVRRESFDGNSKTPTLEQK